MWSTVDLIIGSRLTSYHSNLIVLQTQSYAAVADFISNVAMARRGFPRTGISACYGGPLFSIFCVRCNLFSAVVCVVRKGKVSTLV